eukprot:CAMPEP_0175907200 /NCGR_PEP_ID=MMETSP0108-20121206/5939_1 /TAXON_ID=195067 ORGANISM="Goniomonas pacifica, Strain CCMP1869" /NCGR_SAMPLE_ID=MMETSP0108 /ASSEMBLY_ACC=CAM_ASM_000204 /LENGTH=31 /DNA_ID= /DNA_START= /DNA_END= /DNA_ORIENTATION=
MEPALDDEDDDSMIQFGGRTRRLERLGFTQR